MNTHYKITGKALVLANAFGFLYPGEVCFLQALAQSCSPTAVFVCIGAGTGTATLAMAEIHPRARIFSVDISEGGPEGGFQNERNAFDEAKLSPYPTELLGKSQEMWKSWPKDPSRKIDLLFVDGDHGEDALQADIDGWSPLVKKGGFILFHDYNSEFWGGVANVVDKNMVKRTWRYIHLVDTLIAYERIR